MADPQHIDFRLNTTADTSGAEDTGQSFDDLRERMEKLKEEAKRVGEGSAESDPQLDKLINIQRAEVASKIADGLGKIGGAVRMLSQDLRTSNKELADTLDDAAVGIDSLSGALSGAAQGFAVGGPFGAAVGGTIGLLSGPLKDAYQDMIADLNNAAAAENRAKEAAERLAETRARLAEQIRQENLTRTFREQTEEVEKQVRLLETLAKVEAAGRQAQARVQDATSPASNDQQVERDLSRKIADIDAKVATAQNLAAEATAHAVEAIQNAIRVSDSEGKLSDLTIKAAAERDEAVKSAETAQARAAEIQAIAEAERTEARAQFVEELGKNRTSAIQTISESGRQVLAEIERIADEQGSIRNDTRGAFNKITELLRDGVISADEAAAFVQAVQQLRGSVDVLFNGNAKQLESIIANTNALIQGNVARDAEIARQKAAIEAATRNFEQQIQNLQGIIR